MKKLENKQRAFENFIIQNSNEALRITLRFIEILADIIYGFQEF